MAALGLALELVLEGSGRLIVADLLAVVEVVDVPLLLRWDVQAVVAAVLRRDTSGGRKRVDTVGMVGGYNREVRKIIRFWQKRYLTHSFYGSTPF